MTKKEHEHRQTIEKKDTLFCEESFIDRSFLALEILRGGHFMPVPQNDYTSQKSSWWIGLISNFFLVYVKSK